jgi:hypothetical protein
MGDVVKPWAFWAPSYCKWFAENKRGQIARDEALRAARRAKRGNAGSADKDEDGRRLTPHKSA